jgi:hypothetical protein
MCVLLCRCRKIDTALSRKFAAMMQYFFDTPTAVMPSVVDLKEPLPTDMAAVRQCKSSRRLCVIASAAHVRVVRGERSAAATAMLVCARCGACCAWCAIDCYVGGVFSGAPCGH